MTQAFLDAWASTLGMEGGYSDHPSDPGGRTIYGITERDHPDLFEHGLPSLEACQRRAYERYWVPARCDSLRSALIREELFDSAYNCGQGRAVKFLQKAYNLLVQDVGWTPLVVDGAIGPKTVASVNRFTSKHPDWAFALLKWSNWFQGEHYRKVNNVAMLRGWAKRM
jgi:lysozyme family protein